MAAITSVASTRRIGFHADSERVEQLAIATPRSTRPDPAAPTRDRAIAEQSEAYGAQDLHGAMAEVLRRHGSGWMKASAIAREIADGDLWRRPSDGRHPPASQVGTRARARSYARLFQTSDLGIRLRDS